MEWSFRILSLVNSDFFGNWTFTQVKESTTLWLSHLFSVVVKNWHKDKEKEGKISSDDLSGSHCNEYEDGCLLTVETVGSWDVDPYLPDYTLKMREDRYLEIIVNRIWNLWDECRMWMEMLRKKSGRWRSSKTGYKIITILDFGNRLISHFDRIQRQKQKS